MSLAIKNLAAVAALIAAMTCDAVQAQERLWDCGGRRQANVSTVHLPPPIPPTAEEMLPRNEPILTIAETGQLNFNDEALDIVALREVLIQALADSRLRLRVKPAENTPFSNIVAIFKLLNDLNTCQYVLVGNEWHSEVFSGPQPLVAFALPPTPAFGTPTNALLTIRYDKNSTRVRTGRKRSHSGCYAYFYMKPVNSSELRNIAFRQLDLNVKRYGWLDSDSQVTWRESGAIVQAEGSTPWKCVAGAIYNMQISGYPAVDLVALADQAISVAKP